MTCGADKRVGAAGPKATSTGLLLSHPQSRQREGYAFFRSRRLPRFREAFGGDASGSFGTSREIPSVASWLNAPSTGDGRASFGADGPTVGLIRAPSRLATIGPRMSTRLKRLSELASVRESLRRGSPFGSDDWQREAAERLGLQSTLRPRGRPRKLTL